MITQKDIGTFQLTDNRFSKINFMPSKNHKYVDYPLAD